MASVLLSNGFLPLMTPKGPQCEALCPASLSSRPSLLDALAIHSHGHQSPLGFSLCPHILSDSKSPCTAPLPPTLPTNHPPPTPPHPTPPSAPAKVAAQAPVCGMQREWQGGAKGVQPSGGLQAGLELHMAWPSLLCVTQLPLGNLKPITLNLNASLLHFSRELSYLPPR